MGEEVSKASGPGHTGSPSPCNEKPLNKDAAPSDYPFERLPVLLGGEQRRSGSGTGYERSWWPGKVVKEGCTAGHWGFPA